MKQGVGYSVTINIMAIFIVVTFAFLATTLNYYKAYKVNNAISSSIEKYEGYNDLAKNEIESKLISLGYVRSKECSSNEKYGTLVNNKEGELESSNVKGYCVYYVEGKNNTFKYNVVTYINFNIPIINTVLNLPVKTTTETIYYFSD